MPSVWSFHTAGRLVFGSGAAQKIGELTASVGVARVLVVTDPALIRAGLLDQVRAPLVEAGITVDVFDGGRPEPPLEVADEAIEQARRFKPDGVLGLGGGSNMDLAKTVATVFTHGGGPRDYFSFDNVPGPVVPIICVPTTSGTGSEVSHAAVLTDASARIKVSTLSNHLRPRLAVVDPRLTLSCPPKATADSGIDALTHAVEAYTAVDADQLAAEPGQASPYYGRNPLCDALAEKAIALIARHLVTAVCEGDNLRAREGMSLAATLAGMAFSNAGVALVHALEYPIGGALHCSHGAGNGLLLPFVMRYNLPERTAALARIAALWGEDTSGLDETQAAERAVAAIEQLKRDIGIPLRLAELGATKDQLPGFAEKAFAIKRLMQTNPRTPTLDDLLGILQAAL